MITQNSNPTNSDEIKHAQRHIFRASLLLTVSVLFSRVIGFVRELALAHTIGASRLTDVYLASFTIPDFFNYLMAAGALSTSFIPIVTHLLKDNQLDQAKKVYRTLAGVLMASMVLLVVIAEVWAEPLCHIAAPGFGAEDLAELTKLVRIILPAQVFFVWGGVAIAIQQANGKFIYSALAPIFYNLGIIVFGVGLHKTYGVEGFSIGVLVGAFVSQGILQWFGLFKLQYPFLPSFSLDPEVWRNIRRFFWLSLPIMLGFSIVVTDEWIAKYFASYLGSRAITWIGFARTIQRVPMAVIGQIAGIASYPFLAKFWAKKDFDGFAKTLIREIEKIWAAGTLASVYLVTHALPITEVIYGQSRLTREDLVATSHALEMLGVGLVFWALQIVLSRGFYACQKTWLPSVLGTVLSFAFIPFYSKMSELLNYQGLSLAGTVSVGVYCLCLVYLLRRHLRFHIPTLDFKPLIRFCGLWLFTVAILGFASHLILVAGIYQQTRLTSFADAIVALIFLCGFGLLAVRKVYARFTEGPLF